MYQSRLVTKRVARWVPWVSAFVLVAGIVSALVVFVGNTGTDYDRTPVPGAAKAKTPVIPKPERTAPLDPAAREVAGRFILTAVTRENLAAAWKLAGPEVRGVLTRKEWMTGNIPVDYYPGDAIDKAPMRVTESHRNSAFLQVQLLPKPGLQVKPQLYVIGLENVGKRGQKRWVVSYFAAYSAPGTFVEPGG